MRILQIMGGSDVDGVKTHIVTLAQALSKCCEVCFVSLSDVSPQTAADGLLFRKMPSFDAEQLRRLTAEFQPDIMHCFGSMAAEAAVHLREEYKLPVMETIFEEARLTDGDVHGMVHQLDYIQPATEDIAAAIIRSGFAPYCVFPSESQKSSIAQQCDHMMERYTTILRRAKRPKRARDGIVICGAYGRGNTGDDAILQAIVQELREIDPDCPITIITRAPEEAKLLYRADAIYTFRFDQMVSCFHKTAVYINGGGSLIQDVTSSRSLQYYLFTLKLAKRHGCKVMMYGCGIGPLDRKLNRKMAARVINRSVDVITLRDHMSLDALKQIGATVPEIRMAADPAFQLQPAAQPEVRQCMENLGIPTDRQYIGVGLRDWRGMTEAEDEIAAALDYAYTEHGLTPLFVPIEYPADLHPAERVMQKLNCPHYLVRDRQSIELTLGILAQTKTVMGVRLHSLLFSAAAGVPVIGMSYDIKVDGFLEYIESKTCIPLGAVTKERLIPLIDRCASGQLELEVKRMADMLREKEKENVRTVQKLLSEQS